MSTPRPISGYPEWLPAERVVEQQLLDTLRRTFELHGYVSIETRAVEPLDQLLRKGEIDKEVYLLRRLHASDRFRDDRFTDDHISADVLALHYDLTVPFARYVLENAGQLQFPFRRYQIQKVWRGERPQEGRYREFWQADIDVIDRDELPFHYDIETARVMAQALSGMPFPTMRMQVNNRKLIEGYYRGIGITDIPGVMRVIDKLDKIGLKAASQLLVEELGLSAAQADSCLALAGITGDELEVAREVKALGVNDPMLEEGLEELVRVVEGTRELSTDRFTVVADLRIARGLDYYTGTVYETRMAGFEQLGSVCSGGRYDSLASDGKVTYPGVGISLGVTRLLAPLFSRHLLSASRSTPTVVLVALPDTESRPECDRIADALRGRGISAEVAPSAQKYGKQIRFAERRGIPYVWFPHDDGSDEVRDIRSGVQVSADQASWMPAHQDLKPTLHQPELTTEMGPSRVTQP